MSKSWQAHAQHILDAVARIELIESRGDITQDVVYYDAALRNLQTLSEATQHRPADLKSNYPNVPWQEISGFRNILVHNYLGDIDPLTIESVIQLHLNPLKISILSMLETS